jgi:uncharacterized alkaline shock family protein YloU
MHDKRAGEIEIMKRVILDIARASMHELDLVVSEDRRTMLNENAMKSYRIVNKLRNFRTPEFMNYDAFRRLII